MLYVLVFNVGMRVCSSNNLFVLLEKSVFNIWHSRSEIEWSCLLKCQATGSPLLLSQISSTSFSLKGNHHASSTKHSEFPIRNLQTLSKFAMIMKSSADVCIYMNIFSLMEMPTNHLYTNTAVKQVGLHPMVGTPLWIQLSTTLETITTISFLTHHIALNLTFLINNKEPLDNYLATQTLK